jgi:hypothetical protein
MNRASLPLTAVVATAVTLTLVFSIAGKNRSSPLNKSPGRVAGVLQQLPSSLALARNSVVWSASLYGHVPTIYLSSLTSFRPRKIATGIRLRGQDGTITKMAVSGDWVVWLQTFYPFPGWTLRAVNLRTERHVVVRNDDWGGGSSYTYPTIALSAGFLLWTDTTFKRYPTGLIPGTTLQVTNLTTGVRLGLSRGQYCLRLNALQASSKAASWSASDVCTPDRILLISQKISIPSPGYHVPAANRITNRSVTRLLASEGYISTPEGAQVATSFVANPSTVAWIVPYGPLSPGGVELYQHGHVRPIVIPQAVADTLALGASALIWTKPGGPTIAYDITNGDEVVLLPKLLRPAQHPLTPIASWGREVAWVQPSASPSGQTRFQLETFRFP